MTLRSSSLSEVYQTFSAVVARLPSCPEQSSWTANGAITGVHLRDKVFSSNWWGHASGSSIDDSYDASIALLGAYGELIENVSCDLWYPDWLPSSRDIVPLWDESLDSTELCVDRLPGGTGVKQTVEASSLPFHRTHRYVNIMRPEEEIHMPREIGLEICGRNNGAAVGATPCEAIVTGLFEIFERYILGKFALCTERFPLLDPRIFSGTSIEVVTSNLKSIGYETLFIDTSLGGRLPVAGVLLLNPTRNTMSLAVAGSHSLIDAITHCLREMLSDEYYKDPLTGWPRDKNKDFMLRKWVRSGFTVGWGGSLAQIDFSKGYSRDYAEAFIEDATSNNQILRRGIEICQNMGCEVYARDCSILGIPSFHVYVSKLSENSFVAHEGVLSPEENARFLAAVSKDQWRTRYLPVLEQCLAGNFNHWHLLAELVENPFVGHPEEEDVCDYFNWPVNIAIEHADRGVSLTTLVAALAYHAGDFQKASEFWRRTTTLQQPFHEQVNHFFDLAVSSNNRASTRRQFTSAFGEDCLHSIEKVISLNSLIRFPIKSSNNLIESHWQKFREAIYPTTGEWKSNFSKILW